MRGAEDPALRGSLDATTALLQEAEDRLARAKEAVAETEATHSVATKHHVGIPGDKSAETVPASNTSDVEKRQRDLERTVQALVSRLQKANDDNKRKDALLRAVDPAYSSESHGVTRPSSHSRSSTSSSSSSRSNQPPPLQHPSPQTSTGNSVGGRGIAIPSSGSASSHQNRGGAFSSNSSSSSGIGSPTPKKPPAAISKHPSTATLEALQKANK